MEKTRKGFIEKVSDLVIRRKKIDEEFYEELEEILIGADVGVNTVMDLMDDLRAEVKKRRIEDAADLQPVLSEKLMGLLRDDSSNELRENPDGITVILFVGVNGVGKTTTIGKLAHRYKQEGKKVLLAAGDTFRAGAIEQLEVWGERVGVEVIKQQPGSDPAAVMFDAVRCQAAAGGCPALRYGGTPSEQNEPDGRAEQNLPRHSTRNSVPARGADGA